MIREENLRALETADDWEVLIIGGGATGLGCAVDCAARGYRTVLLEQADFAQGTSSRSTKLVHGGLRYLRAGNIRLVHEALRERGLLLRNAPQLVKPLDFIIPVTNLRESAFYLAGVKAYDLLAGKLSLGPSRWLSRHETIERLPALAEQGLRGGVLYRDAQFDDARLAIALLQTFADLGGVAINYLPVTAIRKWNGKVASVGAHDLESGCAFEVRAKAIINATGVFCDAVRRLDHSAATEMIAPSQGAHLVLDRAFFGGTSALMVPETDDGRVLFAIPWLDRVLVGTTDTAVERVVLEPRPLSDEIAFLIRHVSRYLAKTPTPSDIRSVFAGLRPLVKQLGTKRTASLPRDHVIEISPSGMVTVTGGKWTTYREMAEQTVDAAANLAGLAPRKCRTADLPLQVANQSDGALLHPALPYRTGHVVDAVRREMARTLEDVLARRTRILMLDARVAVDIAPAVVSLIATELGRDAEWKSAQLRAFTALASGYLPAS